MLLVKKLTYQNKRGNCTTYYVGDGFYYYLNRTLSRTLSLRCKFWHSKHCLGRAVCSLQLEGYRVSQLHTCHMKSKSHLSALELRRKILDRCATRDPARFGKIVEQESVGFSRKARSWNTTNKLRSAMRRARLRFVPNVPKDLSELDRILRSQRWRDLTRTKSGQGHMYAGRCGRRSNESRSLIFMSPSMTSVLNNTKKVFSDGTWDGRPAVPHSSQVFSITTTWDSQVIPLAICLMECKKETVYTRLLQSIHELAPNFYPEEVHCDFEIAQYNAWKAVFPGVRVYGCLFHYAKNVSQKAKQLGYTNDINDSATFCTIIRSCLAIPLLPKHRLLEGLESVMERATLLHFYFKLRPFFQYLFDEWVSKRREVLSVANSLDRTSNVAESFNFMLQVAVLEKRPNVFLFLDGLLSLEEKSKQNIYCMKRGIPTGRPRKISAVNNDNAIRGLSARLEAGHITCYEFLQRASYRLLAPFRSVFPDGSSDSDGSDSD